MSVEERERLHLIRANLEHGLCHREASERPGIGVRQFKRLFRSWKAEGDAGLVSRQRARPSNWRLSDNRRVRMADLLKDK